LLRQSNNNQSNVLLLVLSNFLLTPLLYDRIEGLSTEACLPCARVRLLPAKDERESEKVGENGVNNSSKELKIQEITTRSGVFF